MEKFTSLDNNEWNAPLPLEEEVYPPWPRNVFPEPFESFTQELSRSTETPIELSSMLILAVVSTAAHKKYKVQVKADYHEPINIWALGILPPASRKSRVYNEAIEPLREWELEKKKLIEPLIQAANSKRKTMEVRLKELRGQAAKADESEYLQMQKQIEQIEKDLPEVAICPQIWTGDVTPEHLGSIMVANEEAMSVLSDEGGIFDILNGLYSDGRANIDLFLQAHAGSSVRVDRGSRPPIFMQRAILTMGLTVQPETIKSICKNKTFKGRGLLGRFLYVIPKSNIGYRTLDEPPMAQEHSLRYREGIKAILAHIIEEENKAQHVLHLSSAAFGKWREYAKTVEALMEEEIGYLSHITDWAGKLPGAIARIAALLHIMRHACQCPWKQEITLEDMSAAIKIGHVLIKHALMVYDILQEDSEIQIARTVYNWIINSKIVQFTQRECLRKFRRFKKTEMRPALDILKEHEILRELGSQPSVGRPSELFIVNPHVFES